MQVNKYFWTSIKDITMKNVNINKGKKDIDWEKELPTCITKVHYFCNVSMTHTNQWQKRNNYKNTD